VKAGRRKDTETRKKPVEILCSLCLCVSVWREGQRRGAGGIWGILFIMTDDFELFGDPPPSVAEPQDGGLHPSQIRWILSLTPERLKIHDGFLELALALREAGRKLHGRDT